MSTITTPAPATAKMGRPCKLRPDRLARLVSALESGSTRHQAAAQAGIGKTTLYRWLCLGREEQRGDFRDFCDRVHAAEQRAELRARSDPKRPVRTRTPQPGAASLAEIPA